MYEVGAGLLRWTGPAIGAPARASFGRDGQSGGFPCAGPAGEAEESDAPASVCDATSHDHRMPRDACNLRVDARAILAGAAADRHLGQAA